MNGLLSQGKLNNSKLTGISGGSSGDCDVLETIVGMDDGKTIAAVQNTWYTAIDISGAGKLFRVSVSTSSSNSGFAEIRITYDGNTTTITGENGGAMASGFGVFYDTAYRVASSKIDYLSKLSFSSSLKVEYRQTLVGTQDMYWAVNYALQ